MNEFTRTAMELADSYAESRESEATSKAEGDHGGWETALTQRRRSALLAHLEGGEQKWRPIETAPKEDSVIMYCDEDGNRWLDCSPGHPGNSFGKRAQVWMPLPAPYHGIASPAAELKKG